VGSPAPFEIAYCAAIVQAMRETPINICGRDTLKQLTAMLSRADIVVAPDTGPAHIASAMGTDVLGLYAASNPLRSGPYNSLLWCVNRYEQALQTFAHTTTSKAQWGTKAECEGAMELIEVTDATDMLDKWTQAKRPDPERGA
jgi:heptosyltransferase I